MGTHPNELGYKNFYVPYVEKAMEAIKAAGDTPYVIGRIEAGEKGVTLC